MKTIKIALSLLLMIACLQSGVTFAREVFYVQRAAHGEYFVIGDTKFTARDSCPGVRRGDPVRFSESGPGGFCISAVFIDLRNGFECQVWCH